MAGKHAGGYRGAHDAFASGAAPTGHAMQFHSPESSGRNFIAKATANKGGLHRSLGVPVGQKIPTAKIAKAAGMSGKVGKQARLAQTLAKLRGR